MHAHSLERWRHEHVYLGPHHRRNERRTRLVIALTLAMMALEVTGGLIFGSMALLADGWHMATHAGALALTALAYAFARRHAESARYSFGTGKVGDLAGFSSGVLLGGVAVLIGFESLARLIAPTAILYDESILVACLGLLVNVACAVLLFPAHDAEHHGPLHAHGHAHGHDHAHLHVTEAHADHNLRSAYLHVMADALTSLFAIGALLGGKLLQWMWLDALVGLVGALVILRWSITLMRDTGAVLLDAAGDPRLATRIRAALEEHDERVTDLHVWRLGPGHFAAIVALVAEEPQPPEHYKQRLAGIEGLAHVTIEVNPCPGEVPCTGPQRG
jgi:cation diffusion facilitator family transporter